jgi:hypothetical protein
MITNFKSTRLRVDGSGREDEHKYSHIRVILCIRLDSHVWGLLPHAVAMYVSIRQHTSAYVSIRQHTYRDSCPMLLRCSNIFRCLLRLC